MTAAEELEAMINGTYEEQDPGDTDPDTAPQGEEEPQSTEEPSEPEQGEEEGGETNQEEEVDPDPDPDPDPEPEIDYKGFYEKVALSKFIANGKEVEGFKDPEDLIRAQQMLHGFSDKMKTFKEFQPYIKALGDRKLTKDPEKFELAMRLIDGDPEAVKKFLNDSKIDPQELDLEDVKYTEKPVLPSQTQLMIDDMYEQARQIGAGEKFSHIITDAWDIESLKELIENPLARNDLLKHLGSGEFDEAVQEVKRMELLDSTGRLENVREIDKYRMARQRILQRRAPVTPQVADKTADEKIAAAKKEAEVAEQRRKAADLSKPKGAKPPKPAPKLEELSGDAFRAEFEKLLMS